MQSLCRRRRYHRLEAVKKAPVKVVRLGSNKTAAGSGRRRPSRLRRPALLIRAKSLSPIRFLARLRDVYVDSMLGLNGKGSGLTAAVGSEGLMSRLVPKAQPAKLEMGKFERRLQLEFRRSIRSSGEVAVC